MESEVVESEEVESEVGIWRFLLEGMLSGTSGFLLNVFKKRSHVAVY